jgi:hypothetical protein
MAVVLLDLFDEHPHFFAYNLFEYIYNFFRHVFYENFLDKNTVFVLDMLAKRRRVSVLLCTALQWAFVVLKIGNELIEINILSII